jgi:hypothetical protein
VDFGKPEPGLVLHYSYLWADEYQQGLAEGLKNRPAAIVLVSEKLGPGQVVYVVPITTSPPRDEHSQLPIPSEIKKRLGLDDRQSWVNLTEVNVFVWPGIDQRPIKERKGKATSVFGRLPGRFFRKIQDGLNYQYQLRNVKVVKRGV